MSEVPCDGKAPFKHYLVCDELTPDAPTTAEPTTPPMETTSPAVPEEPETHPCTNVHLTKVDKQCAQTNKNYLATHSAVLRDADQWRSEMSTW